MGPRVGALHGAGAGSGICGAGNHPWSLCFLVSSLFGDVQIKELDLFRNFSGVMGLGDVSCCLTRQFIFHAKSGVRAEKSEVLED